MISGVIVDQSGTPIFGATITLTSGGSSPARTSESDQDGQFSFPNAPAGPFQLSINAPDFKPQTISGTLSAGEYHPIPRITLTLLPVVTKVVVKPEKVIAREQLHAEEQQRVLAVFPNYYVTYLPHAAPLDVHQKFQLAWKRTFDPVTFALVGAAAGLEDAVGRFNGFGSGAQGYARYYGTTYANVAISTFLGNAVFPSLFKQDPRFFYKRSGSVRSRVFYAIAASVLAKGDNGHWQPDYSDFAGDFGAAGISNLYYPPQDRNGPALTFENVGISVAGRAAANLLQEFLIPKLDFKSPLSHHQAHVPNPNHS